MSEADESRRIISPSQRRLQRAPDFTGGRLDSFLAVFLRHGLPGALLGLVCLMQPQMRGLLGAGLTNLHSRPLLYITSGLLLLGALTAYAWYIDGRLSLDKLCWVFYLAAVSSWEEWVFRLAVPYYAKSQGVELITAVVATNLLFAGAHYFTLRWKWQWCAAAFICGMALSRRMENHPDLLLVIGIHWLVTFLNTPRPPGRPSNKGMRPTVD